MAKDGRSKNTEMKYVTYYDLLGMVKDNTFPSKVKYKDVVYIWNEKLDDYVHMIGDYPSEFLQLSFLNVMAELTDRNIEIEERVLTDEERKYLAAVVEPFKDSVLWIRKDVGQSGIWGRLTIEVKSPNGPKSHTCRLPMINVKEEYKGMKPNYMYDLKELEIC